MSETETITAAPADGVHAMVPRAQMTPAARKLRDIHDIVPGTPIYHKEFGFYVLDRWKREGKVPEDFSRADMAELFHYDPPGDFTLGGCGWCEAAFVPAFETRVIEDRGEHEVVQDFAGRHVLCFKGRRSGFMPEYLDHPVKDMKTWEENVKWRLDPTTPERYAKIEEQAAPAVAAAGQGKRINQNVVGGYMYLRSLIGPENLFYAVYDQPELIRDCMETWFKLADAVIAKHQEYVTFDQVGIAEDICYNNGPLISPDMIREFLMPYYRQLLANMRSRQIDKSRRLFFFVDSDGYVDPIIDLYREMGMDSMGPFEVASKCDIIRTAGEYPELVVHGGIDKRVLATTPAAIDKMVERIIPAMVERGGAIPTCDHGVPEEVSFENYMHYRKRCVELGG